MKKRLATLLYRLYTATLPKTPWFEGRELVFNIAGRNYYRWKDSGKMPMVRVERLQNLVIMLKNRVDENEYDLLTEIIETSLQKAIDGLNRTGKMDGLQNASHAVQEMRSRKTDLMFHPELMFQISAIVIVGDDEDPFTVNDLIIKEKIELFKKEANHLSFFLQAGLKEYLPNTEELLAGSMKRLHEVTKQYEITKELIDKKMSRYKAIAGNIKSTTIPTN